MSRNVVYDGKYDENDEETHESKLNRIVVDRLVARWNELSTKIEEEGWIRQSIRDGDGDYGPDDNDFDTQKEADAYFARQSNNKAADRLELNGIEDQLSKYGARMMRPYEHLNEDESYVEYQENKYENDY